MSFLSLCISLETIVEGSNELIYRISRCTAILSGGNSNICDNVLKNIKKIYDLRSKIVHGDKPKNLDKLLEKYIWYLRFLCSKIIINVALANINDRKVLNDKLTSLGFGSYRKLSPSAINCNYNTKVTSNLKKDLTK